MLQNIKSYYLIKFIYTFVEEVQKLRLVRYNKSIQNNLDISIINYKFFKGNYIIYESNGIGKEYYGYNDTLIYEGEYLNGKRNGKGKEYDKYNGELIFEGEYLNGKRNGKGKDCYPTGKLIFEGEYLNGKEWNGTRYDENSNITYKLNNDMNGKGKEYYKGKLEFEGQYLNGKRHGKGKEYNYDGYLKFEGEYLNGQRNGKGKEYYLNSDKLEFEGQYLFDKKWNGKGYDSFGNIIYELKDGKGLIKIYYAEDNALIFEGEYLNGKINGKGKKFKDGQLIFEGEYLYGNRLKGKNYRIKYFVYKEDEYFKVEYLEYED